MSPFNQNWVENLINNRKRCIVYKFNISFYCLRNFSFEMFRGGLRRLYSAGRALGNGARPGHSHNRQSYSLSTFWEAFSGRQQQSSQYSRFIPPTVLLNFSLLRLFNKDDPETAEEKLIMTIKRAILSIQREEYEKAEKILHLALRMAQDLQSKDGITYVYDTLANLAMDRGDFVKAEKLFVDVMQRLFGDGADEKDIRLLHISAKIAHMAEQSGNLEKAKQGFEWTLAKLEEKLKEVEEDPQLMEIWGMTKNWYGQSLMQMHMMKDAKKSFEDAKKAYQDIHGKITEESLMLLNNLGVVCTHVRTSTSVNLPIC